MKVAIAALLVWPFCAAYTISGAAAGSTVRSATVSACGYYTVTQDESTARVWGGGADGVELQRLQGHTAAILAVAATQARGTSANPWMVTGSEDNTSRIWDLADGTQLRQLNGHTAAVRAVAISPDETFVVTGGADNTARRWRVSDGVLLANFTGHFDWVRSVAVSPDNAYVATGSDDRTVRVWDAASGAELLRIPTAGRRQFDDAVRTVSFGPNGSYVVAGTYGRAARAFNATNGAELELCISGTLPKHAASICQEHSSTLKYASPDGVNAVSGATSNQPGILVSQTGAQTGSGFAAAVMPQDRSDIDANENLYGEFGSHEPRRRRVP
jgi:WD40 repeat protein